MPDGSDMFDVVVVGGGPGGACAAASLLGRDPRCSVMVVDKSTFPRDKCCGDGIGPGVVEVAERLGLTGLLDSEVAIGGCTVIGPGSVMVDSELPLIKGRRVQGYVVPRTVFDERLLANATGRGAELVTARFTGTWMAGDRRIVELSTPDGTRTVAAKLLVGADGASSRVRRALGVGRNGDRTTGIAIRSYVDVVSEPTDTARLLFEFNEALLPAYAWYFPNGKGIANVGLGLPVADHKRRHSDLSALLAQFLEQLRSRGFVLSEPRAERTYLLPLAFRLPRLAHERAVLLGDAASMINPLSGEGIFYAMAAGEMLAEVSDSLDDPKASLAMWERAVRRRFGAHYRSNALAMVMLRSRTWSRVAIRAAAKDERVLAAAVQLLFGEGSIKLSTTGRLIRAGLS